MSKNWLVTCCFVLLARPVDGLRRSCAQPAGLIDEQAFIPLYADIHQLEASIKKPCVV